MPRTVAGLRRWLMCLLVRLWLRAGANNISITPPNDRTAYVTGFEITGGGATGASVIAATLTGLTAANVTFTYDIPVPAGVTGGIIPLVVQFSTPIPGRGKGQAIGPNVPSFGSGNTRAAVALHGFSA